MHAILTRLCLFLLLSCAVELFMDEPGLGFTGLHLVTTGAVVQVLMPATGVPDAAAWLARFGSAAQLWKRARQIMPRWHADLGQPSSFISAFQR
ncbi:hypothetical protein H8K47_01670 [Undibacterium sp. CY7W]|uniref:Uncharacterized protein n=1 Tax=Undibacterium rugosum TaxID=2762291 RepID=A0A923KUD0_9BURK|nr:hypothetical protein [Undibacterium rugosum]MBC3934057.1 hypothetical protein [Undibacterium rugosum]